MVKSNSYIDTVRKIGADKTVADQLRLTRIAMGITQRAVAAEAGIDPARLCRYEKGVQRPRPLMFERILSALDRLEVIRSIPLYKQGKIKTKMLDDTNTTSE